MSLYTCFHRAVVPGDFAMLLRAGMSPKQAIIYNCLSSVLCFIGMLIGVAIGNIENASLWIFAVVGGMFLYIALVDMVGVIQMPMLTMSIFSKVSLFISLHYIYHDNVQSI